MTTTVDENVTCALCGSENSFTTIATTNALGSSDLDLRPPEMERPTINTWVQRCANCGYCAPTIDQAGEKAANVVSTDRYQNQLADDIRPSLANSFVCEAMIEAEEGDYAEATRSLLKAAWACDDADLPEKASACRDKSISMFRLAQENGQHVSENPESDGVLLVDLLRRAGRSQEAREAINKCRSQANDDLIIRILDFQKTLVQKGDTSCHKVSEVPERD